MIEGKETSPPADCIALQRVAKRSKAWTRNLKTRTSSYWNSCMDQEDDLIREQAALDKHDYQVADLSQRVEQLSLLV